LVWSAVVGALSALLGHVGALTVPRWFGFESTTTSGMMAVAAGFLFLLAWLFAPRQGILTRRFSRGPLAPDPIEGQTASAT
jgi:manganese/zinc/iron transport system permease protein